ncbi:MAG: 16S rRNA (guanine(527)-N(7))-methyltransferase RsmG [Erysipelothrix sp.]|nr:16S rRNA (guanine(527)-N(7))-methyltransferase RsmG [Erysipelothrix sp.]
MDKRFNNLDVFVDVDKFDIYKNHLQEVNKVLNLTAITDDEGIYLKHFYDSLLIEKHIPKNASLCDIGSGAGFPGLVLAIARPDLKVTLVEPTLKRCNFLNEVIELLDLNNVIVLNERAEDLANDYREEFDVVTARAVAYLDILSELCLPLVKPGGLFVAMKGAKGIEELNISKNAIRILGGNVQVIDELYDEDLGSRINIVVDKTANTPGKYPRNYGRIKKTPLSGRKNG